ncbi:MAG: multiheme c-type cytochrome [Anaerolineales bacterium]|nr:hypothetical protein [Anaerolineales bacterium]MCS7247718.1 hypothetical protein [Anaerolineales bacterium]MDW8161528.1 multiheme c-type cytochrome [Anaerolineales bacterium]MDW8446864.1 multiheme c-type cytochrome [Anaerolineales bacterium]
MRIIKAWLVNLAPWTAGALVGGLAMLLSLSAASAAPLPQDPSPQFLSDENCKSCHLNITNLWAESAHAHAFDDPYFQERWNGLGKPGDCLVCHTTNYNASDGSYAHEGVSCEACHGRVEANHPPAVVPVRSDTEFCGTCHTTTIQEWRLSRHSQAGVGCIDCHDPHSQQSLFEVKDDLCINCHQEDMEAYLEDIHINKNIGCVDCHALVIPPDPVPVDGIVPTGHTFTITPATCVACHTDALHAGFSLPGFERGAKAATEQITETLVTTSTLLQNNQRLRTDNLATEQRIQALEAALASRQLARLFQGGIIGLVLGASTAWLVAHNVRRTFGASHSEPKAVRTEESDDQQKS